MKFTRHNKVADAPAKLGDDRESAYAEMYAELAKLKHKQVLAITLEAQEIEDPDDHERKRTNIAAAIRRGIWDYRDDEDVTTFRVEKTETGVRVVCRAVEGEE